MRVLLTGDFDLPLGSALRAFGHEPVFLEADVLDLPALIRDTRTQRADAIIHQPASHSLVPMRPEELSAVNRRRVEGTANVVALAVLVGAHRFLLQSTVFGYGYGDLGRRPLEEGDPFGKGGAGWVADHLTSIAAAEAVVFDAPDLEGIALHFGLLYGAPDDPDIAFVKGGEVPVGSGGAVPMVHAEDAAAAAAVALERGQSGESYNIVDDHPVSWLDYFTALARANRAAHPARVPGSMLLPYPMAHAHMVLTGAWRVSNAKAKTELGWRPVYPSIYQGLDVDGDAAAGPGR